MVLWRCLHRHVGLHVGSLHVRSTRDRVDKSGASSWLRGVRVTHATSLGLERWWHATALARTVAELVVRGVAHLLVVVVAVGGVAAATSALGLKVSSASTFALR
jgi:Mrp family chromosome partitioning ATPase